jgi:hypothetical protein
MNETFTVLSALLIVLLYAIRRGHSVSVGIHVGPSGQRKPDTPTESLAVVDDNRDSRAHGPHRGLEVGNGLDR